MIAALVFSAGWLLALALCAYTAPTEEARRFAWAGFVGSVVGTVVGGLVVVLIAVAAAGLT
ncbi:hypothetical protein [Nocardia thailandica]|uniref:hypothetical protein n=1 Tax=Nocardia thailandica TaxID=257275 RepID=UPI0002DD7857|nr:hypothetical protein [Nocardia thailandica]